MKKTALILHAWLNGANAHWYPWLKTALESRGYTVYLPEIPTMNTDTPNLGEQMAYLEKNIPFHKDMIVFGHSLGSVLALRLAEKYAFTKMFLVAGWDFNDLYPQHALFWPNALQHEIINKNVHETYIFTSDNDPYMTAFQCEEMSKRLNGTFILMKGAGHFTDTFGIVKIPELLAYI